MGSSQRLRWLISRAGMGVEEKGKCCACGHVGTTHKSYSEGPQELSLKLAYVRLGSRAVSSAK